MSRSPAQPAYRLLPIIWETVVAGEIVDSDNQLGFVETLPGTGQVKLSGLPGIARQTAFAFFIHPAKRIL